MFIKMVLYNIVTVILLLLLQQVTSQEIPKTAVEGLSTNVDFLCDLDRQFNPLYWDIQGRVYDLYSIPALFTVRGHEGITLGDVDRRMNGWRFQCFTIDPSTEEGFNPGLVTILTVIFNSKQLILSNISMPDMLELEPACIQLARIGAVGMSPH